MLFELILKSESSDENGGIIPNANIFVGWMFFVLFAGSAVLMI
jgi:hypothetical protein